MENNNNPEKTNVTAAPEQPQLQQTAQGPDQQFDLQSEDQLEQQSSKRDLSKITVRGKTIKVSTMIRWAVILLIYLFIRCHANSIAKILTFCQSDIRDNVKRYAFITTF